MLRFDEVKEVPEEALAGIRERLVRALQGRTGVLCVLATEDADGNIVQSLVSIGYIGADILECFAEGATFLIDEVGERARRAGAHGLADAVALPDEVPDEFAYDAYGLPGGKKPTIQ
jgi:hypothetical protein